MDRSERWGNKATQREERERYEQRPQHARVSLRVLQCVDCLRVLSTNHSHALGNRCVGCWEALRWMEGVEVYG